MRTACERLQRDIVRTCLILALLIGMGLQAHATVYYVSTNATSSDGNNGLTEGTAWRHVKYAASKAQSGDHVYIKAGNYGNEYYMLVTHSGTEQTPIIFEGYGGTVQLGTLPNPRTAPSSDLDHWGMRVYNCDWIVIKNLNFTYYYNCLYIEMSDHVTVENIYVDKCGTTGASGTGIFWKYSNYGQIIDCTVRDAGGNNVMVKDCNNVLIDNLTSLGTLQDEDQFCTDYYCIIGTSHDVTVQNSYAEDTQRCDKGNHGFIIKDNQDTPYSYNCLIQDCEAYGFEECFSVAHYAYNNTFLRCYGDTVGKDLGFTNVLNCRNGAHDNTFQDCWGIGDRNLIGLADYEENSYGNKYNNKFINCRLTGTGGNENVVVNYRRASNNVFQNCVFDNVKYLGRYITATGEAISGNTFKNCIISGVNTKYDTRVLSFYPLGDDLTPYDGTGSQSFTYTDFWDNDFSALSGTGNISSDPKFADRANADYHLKSTGGRWNGSTWVIDADHSPCIDAGDGSDYSNEPTPNGDRINIGAYGNTDEASKTPTGTLPANMDNRLKESTPDTVLSTNTFLDVGYNGTGRYRDITWFDMTPYLDDDPDSITDAKLSMYWYFPTTTRAADTVVQIMKPESGWDHSYTCWNKKSNGVNWTYAGGDWTDANGTSQGSTPFASVTFAKGTVATNQYYNWTVTDLVKEIVTAGSNPGFFIKASAEGTANYIAFYASGNASNRPKLSITRIASQTEGSAASDNRLKSSDPNTVLLTSTFNDVGTLSGNNYRDLIWFDLSPFADVETITSAKLSLYWYWPSSTRVNDTIVDIYRPAAGWDKNYVTWNTKASGVSWSHAGGDWYDANATAQGSTPFASVTFDNAQVATNQYYEFDVTALVNYYRSTGTNAGFFIKARTEGDNYIGFYSLNNASYKPKLEITSTISQ